MDPIRRLGDVRLAEVAVNVSGALPDIVVVIEKIGQTEQVWSIDYLRYFCAVKHRYAGMTIDQEAATAIRDAAQASANGSEASLTTACAEIQLHGGLGFTWNDGVDLHSEQGRTGQLTLGQLCDQLELDH